MAGGCLFACHYAMLMPPLAATLTRYAFDFDARVTMI